MLILLVFIALCVFGPMAALSIEQKHDFKKYSFKDESHEEFCKRYYSHFI